MGGFGIVDGAEAAPFGRLRSKSLADEVVSRLNEAILKGQLRPGEKVVEATLSRQMDVSRAPIRCLLLRGGGGRRNFFASSNRTTWRVKSTAA